MLTDLDNDERATLDILLDEDSPHGLMKRPDMHLDESRRLYVLGDNSTSMG